MHSDSCVADSRYCLDHLSNDQLFASVRTLVGRANQALAALLAHLAEVEARGLHRERACASLYTYCVYELRFSEDAALRRVHAARIARRFPVIFDQIAAGEIHLTAVLMLGPHLTDENHAEVLARAKHRTKREIAALVRWLDPLPDVPARVEPLGPAPTSASLLSNPSFAQFAAALSGPVRELPAGERPSDWLALPDDEDADSAPNAEESASDTERRSTEIPTAQRYEVQFTASQEYVDLLEEARDLLAHAVPGRDLDEVHLRAMRFLVAELKKRKFGPTGSSRRSSAPSSNEPAALEHDDTCRVTEKDSRRRGQDERRTGRDEPRQRGRYVPRAVRRAVVERDGQRCAYVAADGQRCRETGCLELHHLEPHALGGQPTVENLSLRCRAHNALAAEQDFGSDFMAQKKLGYAAPARLRPCRQQPTP